MSVVDEDTELRDLLVQTLDKNGVLGKIKVRFFLNSLHRVFCVRFYKDQCLLYGSCDLFVVWNDFSLPTC